MNLIKLDNEETNNEYPNLSVGLSDFERETDAMTTTRVE